VSGRRPEIHIMLDFMAAQSKLPRSVQSKTSKLILQLKSDPSAHGINWESIEGARDRHMKSARVDLHHRAIVYERGGVLVLLWVDKHDDAYRWARNRVVEINPTTSSVQVSDLGLIEIAQENATKSAIVAPAVEKLFRSYNDKDLSKVGVPESLFPAVRAMSTEFDLEAAKSGIPADAYDALVCLAAGFSVEETIEEMGLGSKPTVVAEDFAAALKTDESRRTFWLVEDDEELRRMLDEPLEFWRIFLHPSQRKLVQRSWGGAVLVRGGAGTGKTVVAMHRARWLADAISKRNDQNGRVLFTTFTTNLAADVAANLQNLCSKDQLFRIEVVNLDRWVVEFMKRNGYDKTILYLDDDKRREDAWEHAVGTFGQGIGLSIEFLKDEWRQVVQANGLSELKDYLRVQRTGRGTPLDRKTKERVWAIFSAYRARLDQEGLSEPEDAYRAAREILSEKPALLPYRAVVVDEAQDLGAEAFKLIAAIAPKIDDAKAAPDSLFIVGDAHQRIYGRKASMTKCGIDVRGRSRKLKVCYRTSDEIRRWAVAVMEGVSVDDLDEASDDLRGYRSLFHGPVPEVIAAKTTSGESNALIEWIEDCKDDGIDESDICVLTRLNAGLKDIGETLKQKGYKTVQIAPGEADNRTKAGIRLSTMHRSKGLEFVAVALVRVNEDIVPPKGLLNLAADAAIRKSLLANERSLIHVSATRAKRRLLVSSSGHPSELIAGLEPSSREPAE
jgi:superfamily I DNA/RNA helicase